MADITGMLQAAAGVSGEEADPNFNQTVLLLHGDGTNGAQNNTFLDSSTNNFTITRNGNTTQGTFSPFSVADGAWSNFFDGSGDSISFTGTAVGTDDITFEAWIYLTAGASSTYYALIDARTSGSPTTGFSVYAVGTGSAATIEVWGDGLQGSSSSGAISLNTWTHVALLRTSGTCQVYVNGATSGSSFTFNNNWTATARIVGTNSGGSNFPFAGYMSNMRLVDGTAITPSTGGNAPLTDVSGTDFLIMQSNRFVDNSSNNRALTIAGNTSVQPFSPFAPTAAYSASVNGGSGYFDGNGDRLTVPNGSDFTFSGAFSVEGWIYPTSLATGCTFLETRTGFTTSNYAFYCNTTTSQPRVITSGGAILSSSINPIANQWNHIAWSSDGSTLRVYVNGVSGGTVAQGSLTTGAATTVGLGGTPLSATSYALTGFLSDLRVVNGTDTYPSAFTLPTAPLTAVTNTKLLCNFTNAGIFDNTGKNNLETVGNAQIDTTTKKYGTGSMEFDGTGDYLTMRGTQDLQFGTGDFTIECWVYFNSLNQYDCVIDFRSTGQVNGYPTIFVDTSSTIVYFVNSANRITSSAVSTGQFYHLAVCRSGTDTKMFIDGVQAGSTWTDTTNYVLPTIVYVGGLGYNSPGTYALDGFIDDLRISRVARYLTSFTPPDKAFPDQ